MIQKLKIMPRGGYRKNAGRKRKWKHGKTTSIRVPESLVDQILEFTYKLDKGEAVSDIKPHQLSLFSDNIIDLSEKKIFIVDGQMGIKLSDLVKMGYSLMPKRLNDIVTESIKREK